MHDPKVYNVRSSSSIVTNLKIENEKPYWSSSGEKKIERLEIDVVCWGKLAERCSRYRRGEDVYIEGNIRRKDLEYGGALEIVARDVQLINPKSLSNNK